jgi:ABC-type anion transport system duplicated permease subunit
MSKKCEMTKGEKVTIALLQVLQAVAVFCFVELVITVIQCYG